MKNVKISLNSIDKVKSFVNTIATSTAMPASMMSLLT